jgi:hypothetical protein
MARMSAGRWQWFVDLTTAKETDMVVIRCRSDEGAIEVNGNGADIARKAFPGTTDLLPGLTPVLKSTLKCF